MNRIIIVPTEKIQRLCDSDNESKYFFSRLPFEKIIEHALELEDGRDFNYAIWNVIEESFSQDEIERFNLEIVDFLITIIIENFYEELRLLSDNYDTVYKVHIWLSDGVCLIPENH